MKKKENIYKRKLTATLHVSNPWDDCYAYDSSLVWTVFGVRDHISAAHSVV